MLYIDDDNKIHLTRGDTARFKIPITNLVNNGEYAMAADDILHFTVKKSSKDDTFLFQRTSIGSNAVHIRPEDTANLQFGKYKYDVELDTASGDVYTVIVPSLFEILEDIT